ncbi:hypothetical protein PsW64_00481 [Pseudovibrio sp. W64]|nr:hypothetical protein PsW64_00481 [Pseudovibrio sp. W64]
MRIKRKKPFALHVGYANGFINWSLLQFGHSFEMPGRMLHQPGQSYFVFTLAESSAAVSLRSE